MNKNASTLAPTDGTCFKGKPEPVSVSKGVASLPGLAQLSIACSTEKRRSVLRAMESGAGPGNEAS